MKTSKRKKYATILAICLGIIFLTGTIACSNPSQNKRGDRKGPTVDEFFQRFDTNQDSKLSKKEFPGPDDQFSKMDENNNDFIEKSEMKEVPPPPRNGQERPEKQ